MFLCGKIRQVKRKSHPKSHLTHCLQGNESSSLQTWTGELANESSIDSLTDLELLRVNKRRRPNTEPRDVIPASRAWLDNNNVNATAAATAAAKAAATTAKTATTPGKNDYPPNNVTVNDDDDDDDEDKENSLPSGFHDNRDANDGKDNEVSCSDSLIVQTSLSYLSSAPKEHHCPEDNLVSSSSTASSLTSSSAKTSDHLAASARSRKLSRSRRDSDKENEATSDCHRQLRDKDDRLPKAEYDNVIISVMSKPGQDTASGRTSLGKIKLTLSIINSKRLVIQVHQAVFDERELVNETLCLQVLLIPDESQKTLQEIQSTNTNPWLFEEPIIYDLTGVSGDKRVLVSVKCTDNKQRRLLGCVSFGIRHLLSRRQKSETVIDNWYHLLPDHLGNHKHITCKRAQNDSLQSKSVMEAKKPKLSRQLERKLRETESIVLNVTKFRGGYGFTIKGSMPVCVGRVKSGGAAEQAGLKNGDYILSINDKDAISLSLEAVANLVRTSNGSLRMQIGRRCSNGQKSKLPSTNCNKQQISKLQGTSPYDLQISKIEAKESCIERINSSGRSPAQVDTSVIDAASSCLQAAERITNWGAALSQELIQGSKNPLLWQPELSVIQEERSTGRRGKDRSAKRQDAGGEAASCSLWQPDLSRIATVLDPAGYRMWRHRDPEGIYEEIDDGTAALKSPPSWQSLSPDTSPSCQPDSYTDTELTESSRLVGGNRHHHSHDSLLYQSRVMESVLYQGEVSDRSADSTQFGEQGQLACAAGRHAAVHRLLTLEADFTRIMKRGVERFSRPLRHQLLSRSEHVTLFQNIEKLIMFSEFHICQMIDKTYCAEDSYMSLPDGAVVDMVGNIYKTKIAMVCDAYQMYAEGVGQANCLLQKLKQNGSFRKFLKETDTDDVYSLDLDDFIHQPIRHFHQLVCCLSEVLTSTSPQHDDYNNIKQVLKVICQTINKPNPRRSASGNHSNDTGYYNNVPSAAPRNRCNSNNNNSNSNNSNSNTNSSNSKSQSACSAGVSTNTSHVDTEIADIEEKISFARHIKPFVIAKPQRHVILSGQLLCLSKKAVTPFWVILCNDLLLLTEKDVRGQLRVTEEPIALQQIVNADFDCVHPAEFRISCQRTGYNSRTAVDWSSCDYKFRATNMEEKYAWKAVLEQRIQYTKSKTDSAYASMEEIL